MQLYTDIDMKLMEAERARLGGGHGSGGYKQPVLLRLHLSSCNLRHSDTASAIYSLLVSYERGGPLAPPSPA